MAGNKLRPTGSKRISRTGGLKVIRFKPKQAPNARQPRRAADRSRALKKRLNEVVRAVIREMKKAHPEWATMILDPHATLDERIDEWKLSPEFRRLHTLGVQEEDRVHFFKWLEPYAHGAARDEAQHDLDRRMVETDKNVYTVLTTVQVAINLAEGFLASDRHVRVDLRLKKALPHLVEARRELSAFVPEPVSTPPHLPVGRPPLPQPRNFEGLVVQKLKTIVPRSLELRRAEIEALASKIARKLGLATARRGSPRP